MTTRTSDIAQDDEESDNTQPGLSKNEKILKEIKDNIKKSRRKRTSWRIQAREDYDFYAGNQWSEEDMAKLSEELRPIVVFNRIIRTVNAISGVEIQNRQEARFYPRNIDVNADDQQQQQQGAPQTSDAGFAEMMTEAQRWVNDQTDSEDEESESFLDEIICGEGWTDTLMDYDDNPQGIVVRERLDPLSMDVDPDSIKRNYEDAKWIAYSRDLSRKEIKEMFPDLDMAELTVNSNDFNDQEILIHDDDEEQFYRNDYGFQMTEPHKIPVIKYQCVKKEIVRLALMDDKVIEISDDRYRKARKFIEEQAQRVIAIDRNVYYQYFVVGNLIADKTKMKCRGFTFRSMTGLRDRNNQRWFGLVTIMKDPQRWSNKWLSQVQHIVNSNNKGGVMIEEGAVVNRRKFEEDYAKPNAILDLHEGGIAKIKERDQIQYPAGVDKLLQFAIESIQEVSGVSLEMLGMSNRDQPIGIEESRKESGVAVLACFFDSLRRYRKKQARITADFIREFIADGRLIRVLGDDGEKYLPLIKSQLAFEYDIIIDDAPSSPRVKERTFAICLKMIEYAIQMGIPVPPEILDYSPLPVDFQQKWKKLIKEQGQPTPEQQQIEQLKQMKGMLDLIEQKSKIAKTDSETEENYAQAQKDKSVAEEQRALAMQKFGMAGYEADRQHHEMMMEHERETMETWLNHARETVDIQLEHMRKTQQPQQGAMQ